MRLSAIHGATSLLAAVLFLPAATALALDWTLYVNERFGASAEIPASGFIPSKPPMGDDGRRWMSDDGLAEISIYGAFTGSEDTWDDYRTKIARQMIRNGVDLVHEAWRDDWFVLSGVRDEQIRYTRAVRSNHCDPPVAVHVFLAYPLDRKNHYDRIVTHMARSLKALPGTECGGE